MDILGRVDDALLDVASRLNGVVRDIIGWDQWTTARALMRVFLVVCMASQMALIMERGFDWFGMLVVLSWIWHYHGTMAGIDRYAASRNGSVMARLAERPTRSVYPVIYGIVALAFALAGIKLSGVLVLIGCGAMIVAHFVKAAEMPPPSERRDVRLAPAF